MGQVTVSAIYDGRGNFYPQGKTFCIDTASVVMPERLLPTSYYAPNIAPPPGFSSLLAVKTVEFGELFLNITLEDYIELVRAADGGTSGSGCAVPVGLIAAPISNGAVIYWTDNPDSVGIEWVNTQDITPPDTSGTFIEQGQSAVGVKDLFPSTTYYFWIRTVCDGEAKSLWTVIQYTTPAS